MNRWLLRRVSLVAGLVTVFLTGCDRLTAQRTLLGAGDGRIIVQDSPTRIAGSPNIVEDRYYVIDLNDRSVTTVVPLEESLSYVRACDGRRVTFLDSATNEYVVQDLVSGNVSRFARESAEPEPEVQYASDGFAAAAAYQFDNNDATIVTVLNLKTGEQSDIDTGMARFRPRISGGYLTGRTYSPPVALERPGTLLVEIRNHERMILNEIQNDNLVSVQGSDAFWSDRSGGTLTIKATSISDQTTRVVTEIGLPDEGSGDVVAFGESGAIIKLWYQSSTVFRDLSGRPIWEVTNQLWYYPFDGLPTLLSEQKSQVGLLFRSKNETHDSNSKSGFFVNQQGMIGGRHVAYLDLESGNLVLLDVTDQSRQVIELP